MNFHDDEFTADIYGLDLVLVLDASDGMASEKPYKPKLALEFLLDKLNPNDRLSVVTYKSYAERHSPLLIVTPASKMRFRNMILDSRTGDNLTNIASGLSVALEVISHRRCTNGRSVAVMLIYGGEEKAGKAAQVDFRSVPVFAIVARANHDKALYNALRQKGNAWICSDYGINLAGLLEIFVNNLEDPLFSTGLRFEDDEQVKNIVAENFIADDRTETENFDPGRVPHNVRPPLDLVMVLDVGGSLAKEKLDKVNKSMELILNNLSPADRLSVVTLNRDGGARLFPLRQMSTPSKTQVKSIILNLRPQLGGVVNIAAGLEVAMAVLRVRRFCRWRTAAIMLMASGQDNVGKSVEEVDFRDTYPIFVFATGTDPNPPVLAAIQRKVGLPNTSYFVKDLTKILKEFVESLDHQSELDNLNFPENDEIENNVAGECELDNMNFQDDDEIGNIVAEDVSADENAETIPEGRTSVTVINNPEAPLGETKFKVMLELMGTGLGKDRPGLDLVTVLDVSGRMGAEKLDKMKISMEFLLNKLSPIDRLSVVVFSGKAVRLFPLRRMTRASKTEFKDKIFGLRSEGDANIASGLEIALRVLGGRRFSGGRTVAIMLMSNGVENIRKAAEEVNFDDVPVFTFGFGADHDPRVLTAISQKSKSGTFSDVQKQEDLSSAFAQCLAGLLTTVVERLELTVKGIKATIVTVCAGNYNQTSGGSSVTVSFGNLYLKEVRKVIVELLLPKVAKPLSMDVLQIAYNYTSPGDPSPFDAAPVTVRLRRKGTVAMPERPEMMIEESRIMAAQMMKEARMLADDENLRDARNKLAEAQNLLQDVVTDDESNNDLEMMQYELSELVDMMQSQQVYAKQGRPFALSSETSHALQRYATRGDVEYLRSFCTPRMRKYVEQVAAFEEDPTRPVPTEEEDVEEELAANPLAPIAGALSYYIQNAISSLQAIDRILKLSS